MSLLIYSTNSRLGCLLCPGTFNHCHQSLWKFFFIDVDQTWNYNLKWEKWLWPDNYDMAWPHWVCLQGSRGRGVPAVIVAMMTWPRLKILIVENYFMWHVIWLQWISSWQCCFSTFFFLILMFQSDMFLPLLLPNQPDTVGNQQSLHSM